MPKGTLDPFDIRRVPRRILIRQALRYGIVPSLQKAVLSSSEEYEAFLEQLMKTERFQHLKNDFLREFNLKKWEGICIRPKLHEHESNPNVPSHVLKRMNIDYRKYDKRKDAEQKKRQTKQRKRWEEIKTEFDMQRTRNQVIQIVARQSTRWDGSEVELKKALTTSFPRLTKLPCNGVNKWNKLNEIPKERLKYAVLPDQDRKAIQMIDDKFVDEYVDVLLEFLKTRFIKDAIRAGWESKHPSTRKTMQTATNVLQRSLKASQSCSALMQRKPRIQRNHPERAGYDFTDYNGIVFDPDLCPEGKCPVESRARDDIQNVIEWKRRQAEFEESVDRKKEKLERRRLFPSASVPNLSIKQAWREELADFEERLPKYQANRVYD